LVGVGVGGGVVGGGVVGGPDGGGEWWHPHCGCSLATTWCRAAAATPCPGRAIAVAEPAHVTIARPRVAMAPSQAPSKAAVSACVAVAPLAAVTLVSRAAEAGAGSAECPAVLAIPPPRGIARAGPAAATASAAATPVTAAAGITQAGLDFPGRRSSFIVCPISGRGLDALLRAAREAHVRMVTPRINAERA
jgi:hypothetical protein